MPTWEGAILRGKQANRCKYSDTPQLNRLRCHLGCGLAWAQGIMCYMGFQIPHLKRQFWWIGAPIVNYSHFLPLAVQKGLNRSICHFSLWTRMGQRMQKFSRISQVAPMCPHGGTHCRHLSNNIEPSVYGGDAPYVKLLWALVISLVISEIVFILFSMFVHRWCSPRTNWRCWYNNNSMVCWSV